MRSVFEDDGAEAALMVDVPNTFNSLNREAALRNTYIVSPPLAPMLTNTHRSHSWLFIVGNHILAQEGTMQGDPVAMALYAINTLPLINKTSGDETLVWYAGDASAGGTVPDLGRWWDKLQSISPLFCYYPNHCNTWL